MAAATEAVGRRTPRTTTRPAAAREQTLRRQLAEVQRPANVVVEAKDEQLRRVRLASRVDVFGRRTLEAVRRLRSDCAELRHGVRTPS
ncbi:hypothetical protein [Parvibaculum sp.]|uniref:hypothetical protein n=1 Tax=Parvibaculum sp. TaxID=2024848 RepID=UPI003BAD61D6